MPNFLTGASSPVLRYFKLRLRLASVEDPVRLDELTSEMEDVRAKSFAASMLGALWDIQIRYPAIFPLIALSFVLKYFF